MLPLVYVFLSFLIVAFGVPYQSLICTFLASTIGYALFWRGVEVLKAVKHRFITGGIWMVAVQLIQLSWLGATTYQGFYIILVYLGVAIWFGVQWGALTILVGRAVSKRDLFALAGLWTLFEWSRLWFLCGFPFNPAGLSLSWGLYPMQLAAVGGIYLLSFWVMATNLLAYTRRYRLWAISVMLPIVFGIFHAHYHMLQLDASKREMATLVQPALLPDQKAPFQNRLDRFIAPLKQWEEMITLIPERPGSIILPEALTPFSYDSAVYPLETAVLLLDREWGHDWVKVIPPLERPYAEKRSDGWYVTNAFWAQAIANHYDVEVIAGFDARDKGKNYNAAFHFSSGGTVAGRYDKRILVPLAEYLPFSFLRKIVANRGIVDHFTHGKVAGVFNGKALSICYEECYAHMMREGKKHGAKVYVNVTNDGWFAHSNLPLAHLYHARLRAVENGVPLLRTSNTGGTALINALGKVERCTEKMYCRSVLHAPYSTYNYATLYTWWGDWMALTLTFGAIIACVKSRALLTFSLTQLRIRGRN